MSDLSRLIDDLCAGLDGSDARGISGFPETLSDGQIRQAYDKNISFRSFRPFRSEDDEFVKTGQLPTDNTVASPSAGAHAKSCVKVPERPERPERETKSRAETTSLLFPVKNREPERPETDRGACGRPFLDLNHAAPQRFDWWIGPAMAEAEGSVPPPGAPLPIAPADVRAGVARELRALAQDGREGPAALRDAVEITRAKIRNSEALAERQAHGGRCHVCDGPLDDGAPVVAVLSWSRGEALHLHAGCHDAYSARRIALVDRIMDAAGYGEFSDTQTREGTNLWAGLQREGQGR